MKNVLSISPYHNILIYIKDHHALLTLEVEW